ncbi:MAG: GntR family transcriptional regulator [Robiginitomaculum sp.]|nr:MAG: GntR family transcriptional regulator [Robiginitomaculum sp.]
MKSSNSNTPAFLAETYEQPKLRKKSDQIAEEMKRLIVIRGMEVGDRLPKERDLMEWFACGKGTMREALKSLEIQGLITMRTGPKGGPVLREPSYARAAEQLRTYLNFKHLNIGHIYDARLIIEPEMAVAVVEAINDELLHDLSRACQHSDNNSEIVRHREIDFHVTLARHCPNPLLSFQSLFISNLLSDFVRFDNPSNVGFSRFTKDNCQHHEQLINAFSAQNHADVRDIMRAHMESAKMHTMELYGTMADSILLAPQGVVL